MARPQLTLNSYSGSEDNFCEFEQLLRSILVLLLNKLIFLQLHPPDAALRFFQTLTLDTRQSL